MKQKHWILTFAAIIAVCLLVWLLPRGGGQTALVYQDGTLFYTLDLRQNRTLTVTGPAGKLSSQSRMARSSYPTRTVPIRSACSTGRCKKTAGRSSACRTG